MGKHINIPLFIPQRGCPHTCIFCDQKKISGQSEPVSEKTLVDAVERHLATAGPEDTVEIAFFGGSFTGLPKKDMLSYLQLAYSYVKEGKVTGIRVSTRPDYIDEEILDYLIAHEVKVVELGVQSLDPDVLNISRRGHTVEDVERACRLIHKKGLTLGIQTMLGLPGDSIQKALDTARGVIALKPAMVRIYPALVLRETALEQMMREGLYTPLSLTEAVTWSARIVPLYEQANIHILRLGLYAEQSLLSSVTEGPCHPAFGELVASQILFEKICDRIEQEGLYKGKSLEIRVPQNMLSKVTGQHRSNIERLKQQYGFDRVQVKTKEKGDDSEPVLDLFRREESGSFGGEAI